ncbi:hypothetical protein Nmel_003899 [Mimus melanotis]
MEDRVICGTGEHLIGLE